MHITKDVEKIVMPITIVWLALSASLLVYGGLLFYLGKTALVDVKMNENLSTFKAVLWPLSFVPFILTFIFHRKKEAIIKKVDMEKAPYAKGLQAEEKKALSYFGSYFIVHLVLWIFNEAGAILGLVLTMAIGNFNYYLYPALIALFLNLVIMRPNYFQFIKGKRLE